MSNNDSFFQFIGSYISLSVISSLFTYRLINSLLDNIIYPLFDISFLPDKRFSKLSNLFDTNKNPLDYKKLKIKDSQYKYVIRPGLFLKELIIWTVIMLIMFLIYKFLIKK